MSNSPLVVYKKISPNKNSPRNHVIDTITIHCVVGQLSAETVGNIFQNTNPGHRCSANYCVDKNGRVGMYVEEKDRSWCSSSGANDHRAITIEVACDTTRPYAVKDNVYKALIELVVDICKRNNIKRLLWEGNKSLIGNVSRQNMTVHKWFTNKECPGQYLYDKHPDIVKKVNAKLGVEDTKVNKPVKVPSSELPYKVKVSVNNLRIRRGPGTNYSINAILKPGVYTIIEEANGVGAKRWGRLKSRVGWISLDYAKKVEPEK